MRNKPDSLSRLQAAGFNYEDACALRRISMTLHRWHELECGDGNNHGSWAIERGKKRCLSVQPYKFDIEPDSSREDGGEPFMVHYHYGFGRAPDRVSYTSIPDRERGALKRLEAIMKRYPGFGYYVQGDPRGCALYVMRPGDVPAGESVDAFYTRGIAVHK